MEFKKCALCGDEKTIRQFSTRIIDVCTSCIMKSAKRIKTSKSFNSTLTPRDSVKYSHISRPSVISAGKVFPVALKKIIGKHVSSMGYKVIDTPNRATVRSGSITYTEMSEEQKREILKAEYRERKVKDYSEKIKKHLPNL